MLIVYHPTQKKLRRICIMKLINIATQVLDNKTT